MVAKLTDHETDILQVRIHETEQQTDLESLWTRFAFATSEGIPVLLAQSQDPLPFLGRDPPGTPRIQRARYGRTAHMRQFRNIGSCHFARHRLLLVSNLIYYNPERNANFLHKILRMRYNILYVN